MIRSLNPPELDNHDPLQFKDRALQATEIVGFRVVPIHSHLFKLRARRDDVGAQSTWLRSVGSYQKTSASRFAHLMFILNLRSPLFQSNWDLETSHKPGALHE
jgi:hypothetical protein